MRMPLTGFLRCKTEEKSCRGLWQIEYRVGVKISNSRLFVRYLNGIFALAFSLFGSHYNCVEDF